MFECCLLYLKNNSWELQKTSGLKEKGHSPLFGPQGKYEMEQFPDMQENLPPLQKRVAAYLEQSLFCAILEIYPNTVCRVQVSKTDMEFGSLFTIKQY